MCTFAIRNIVLPISTSTKYCHLCVICEDFATVVVSIPPVVSHGSYNTSLNYRKEFQFFVNGGSKILLYCMMNISKCNSFHLLLFVYIFNDSFIIFLVSRMKVWDY